MTSADIAEIASIRVLYQSTRCRPRVPRWPHIRYLLTTLEDYAQWYESGAKGVSKCEDKTRVFDFSNTTLEHVYPRSAKGAEKIENGVANVDQVSCGISLLHAA